MHTGVSTTKVTRLHNSLLSLSSSNSIPKDFTICLGNSSKCGSGSQNPYKGHLVKREYVFVYIWVCVYGSVSVCLSVCVCVRVCVSVCSLLVSVGLAWLSVFGENPEKVLQKVKKYPGLLSFCIVLVTDPSCSTYVCILRYRIPDTRHCQHR